MTADKDEGFLKFLETRGLRPSTVREYAKDAECFERWWARQKVGRTQNVKETVPDSERVRSYLECRERSPSYHNRLRCSLGLWSEYCQRFCRDQRVSLFGVRNLPRQPANVQEVPAVLHVDEVRRLALAAREHSRPTERQRNVGLILFLYGTGLSAREVCELTLEDVVLDGGMALKVRTGAIDRLIPLSATARDALASWLGTRSGLSTGIRTSASVWVILSANGKKKPGDALDPQGLRAMLARYGDLAEIAGKVTPSRIRRTFASELRGAGVKRPVIQALLGKQASNKRPAFYELTEALSHLPELCGLIALEAMRLNPS